PCQVLTYDGNGNLAAETDYYYDNGAVGTACGAAGTPSVTGVGNLTGHDETNYSAGSTAPRGNVTTEVHKCFIPSTGATCTDSVITHTYDETGQVLSTTDAIGNATGDTAHHTTTYDYTDNFTEGGPAPGNTNAYLTKTTYPQTNGISHIQSYTYAYQDGQLTSSTDQNRQTTTYSYKDSSGTDDHLRRLKSVTGPPDPNNQKANTLYTYYDGSRASTVEQNIDGRYTLAWTQFDGLGRAHRTATLNDEDANNQYDQVDTCFDGRGEKIFQAYPYRSTGFNVTKACSNSQQSGEAFTYDALGRLTATTHTDGNTVTTDYSQFPTVTVTDETQRARQNKTDALGRLRVVLEPDANGNFSYETDYLYDALDNLTQVNQNGDGSQPRVRSFIYDSLSRLLTATNPESGTINYSYDADGNLLFKTSPAPNQASGGTATQTISYCYDSLNRLTGKAYNAQGCPLQSPAASYFYDQSSIAGFPGLTSQYPVGRLVASSTSAAGMQGGAGSFFSYDVMGRMISETEFNQDVSPPALNQAFQYAYKLDGSLQSITYPSGRRIDYEYNRAQRPLSAVDAADKINYYTGALYTPFGAPRQMVYGSTSSFAGIIWTNNYNARMQPTLLSATAVGQPTVLSMGYDFNSCNGNGGNNGNVCQLINGKNGTRNQSFNYDNLNRLLSASSGTWSESFGYDPWGNLLLKNTTGTVAPESPINLTVSGKNQVTNWCYDAAGNLVGPNGNCASYTQPVPSHPFENVFDSENRLTSAKNTAGITTTYNYDADGQRVEKLNADGSGMLYWYGPGGEVLEETDLAGNMTAEYVFLGGKRIARLDFPNACSFSFPVHYYFADHLGSADVVTGANGNIEEESDYYPFGGERVVTDLGIGNNYKFTGKERDPETGLDYFGARYYGSSIGRFVTPDWAATA